jgi:hypothetical protein
MMQWIKDNQALVLMAWPVLSAVFSIVYTQLDKSSRWHAFFSTLAGLGIDIPTIWEAFGRLIKGNTPGGGGKVAEMPGHVAKKDLPPVPPDRVAFSALRKSGVFMIACLALCGCSGCSWLQSPQGVATIKTGVDLAICVLNHSQEPIPQIVTDCGAAAASDVIAILDAHNKGDTKTLLALSKAQSVADQNAVLDAHNAATVRESAAKDGGK